MVNGATGAFAAIIATFLPVPDVPGEGKAMRRGGNGRNFRPEILEESEEEPTQCAGRRLLWEELRGFPLAAAFLLGGHGEHVELLFPSVMLAGPWLALGIEQVV